MADEQSYERSHEARLSARKSDVVIEVRTPRKRSWTHAEKVQILREAFAPGAVAKHVMERHGLSSSVFYTWRKQALGSAPAGFTAVQIAETPAISAPTVSGLAAATSSSASPGAADAMIEIFLPGEVSVRVDRFVDGRALAVVLQALGA